MVVVGLGGVAAGAVAAEEVAATQAMEVREGGR